MSKEILRKTEQTANSLTEHAETLRREAVNAISKSEFKTKLKQRMNNGFETLKLNDLDILYVDYFMSDLTLDEWFQQFSTGEAP